jgi:predicted transcriptional regulator
MNPLLYNYFIDETSSKKKKNMIKVLSLLHELRIISRSQLLLLLNINANVAERTSLNQILKYLKDNNLIDKIKKGNQACYFLTKEGHQSIGGYYTLPKVPEYNLQHHLQINDYLIKMLELTKDRKNLKFVLSERRQVFETKDLANNRNRKNFFVADFIFRFRSKENKEVNWSFEIELTMKTRRRYREGIFPKYIAELKRLPYARLIYVTPSPLIEEELERFKGYFIRKEGEDNAEVFDRLHIFSAEEFEQEIKRLLAEDQFINWE